MFELFLNPANMILGGALISSPIIIHLINRMRYKRLRWAAMEFLLKSQKRNRRRLIIEQLILLLLRILLVLLAGLLLARFLGFSFAGIFQPRNTLHAVILDDRLSMSDHWRNEDGEQKNSFDVARQIVEKEIARPASLARTPQRLVLLRLSDLLRRSETERAPQFDQRLTQDSLKELGTILSRQEDCSALHLNMADGVKAARELLDKHSQDERFLHIVSDFRQRHWGEPEGVEVAKVLESLHAAGIQINLVDAAHPVRSENQKIPLYHDNLAVIDLRPETRVAAEGMPVQFTVTVANYSPSERKNVRVTVKVEGIERPEGSLTILSVPPGNTAQTFQVGFVQIGHNLISVNLENEEVGLQGDNVRYAVVEVRRQVPVLLIDGDVSGGDKPGGDTFHLRSLFTAARGFEVVRGGINDLEKPNLDQYPSIYLLNVRRLSDKGLENLEAYVRNGGSVAFFMGDRVNDPQYYNEKLYAGGKGLFPVPLADRASPELSDEQKQEKMFENLIDPQFQIFLRSETHPIFAELYKFRSVFRVLNIYRYYPVPRLKWEPEPGKVEELVTLPNHRPVSDYEGRAQDILNNLPTEDPRFEKYRPALERHRRAIRDALAGKPLHALANALEALLKDQGEPNNPESPSMVEFWEQSDPKLQELRGRIDKFRETVQLGDPLVVASQFGKGKVVVFLTSAGRQWNDWAGGGPASVTYPVVMLELQKYLTSLDSSTNLTVGTALPITLDGTRYQSEMRISYQSEVREQDPARAGEAKEAPAQKPGLVDLGELSGTEEGGRISFTFETARKPGVYYLDLTERSDMGMESKTERRAFAFNVDALNESDLRRSPTNELETVATGVMFTRPGTTPPWANRRADLSESAWLYLIFLIILVAEQALAVHLSFHLKGNEAQLPAQALGPQASAA